MMTAIQLNLPLDLTEVDLMSEDQRRQLQEINPNGMVPVLQDGDFLLPESCAIMQYLTEQTPGQTLYPQAPRTRAEINRWMFWGNQHFAPAISVLTWEKIWKGMVGFGAADSKEVARGERDLAQFATVLDNHLAGREWVVGNSLSLADFALAAPLMYTVAAKLPVSGYPNLMAWYGRVQALDAWKQTDPVY
ncbi:glutathione S-transferase, C-terminal domain protein [Janthinobacterium agaricidamnosum NBRC 102515 = DSM 9628]|uniref:Glutathione S-transferase, C-terminal domain protein n=2 Tax=Janthinobacterium agaricidamnosum TaxID=55508 RepID=W0UZD1_9BURK|nr:glutathione S-transferase, C-terminal domain protein [Janthinobacterium agaricidamnosum NBRC 102515 = DSM 9628]